MSRRSKIIIAVVIIILLLLGVLLLLQRPAQPAAAPQQPANQQQAPAPLPSSNLTNSTVSGNVAAAPVNQPAPTPAPAPADEKTNVIRLAAAFAERYGSFSNQTSYENLLELKPLMTASFAAATDAYVEQQRAANPPATEYFGITTRAINTTVVSFAEAEGTAQVTVKTQRREISGSSATGAVYYQDITLAFLKQGGEWKVDSATWLKR